MAGRQGPEELMQRKAALIAESTLNRVALRLEWENICAAMERVDQAAATARRVLPWLLPLAPAAGWLLLGRKPRSKPGTKVQPLRLLLRWAPPALAMWRRLVAAKHHRAEDDSG